MRRSSGTSLVEVLCALAFIAVLCGGAAIAFARLAADAATDQARAGMLELRAEIERHRLVPGRPPVRALRELRSAGGHDPVDPWGAPYVLQATRILSSGPDRRLDTTSTPDPVGDDLALEVPPPPGPPIGAGTEPSSLARPIIGRKPRSTDPSQRTTAAASPSPTAAGPGHVVIHIPVESFDKTASRWSDHGPLYDTTPLTDNWKSTHSHAYGGSEGHFLYTAVVPEGRWRSARLTARLSAEARYFPNYDRRGADVRLEIDHIPCGTRHVQPDDRTGMFQTWQLPLTALRPGREVEIVFRVDSGGLCIYGKAARKGNEDAYITLDFSN